MRRALKGGTTHPALARPGYGYGRLQRPSPERRAGGRAARDWQEPESWIAPPETVDLTGRAEATAARS